MWEVIMRSNSGIMFHYKNAIPEELIEKVNSMQDDTLHFKERLNIAKDLASVIIFIDQALWSFEDEYMLHMTDLKDFFAAATSDVSK